jgi:hypothetical protein
MSPRSSETQAPSPNSAPELLGSLFPPLRRYWPNLGTCSAQQAAFLLLDSLEAFYGGAAGGGKSDALLAAALQYVDVPGYAALILRRTFRQLDQPDAIMSRSKEWLTGTDARWNDDAKRWTFPSGATLTFGYLDAEKDVYNYQGPAYQFVGWDELTQFPEKVYKYLFSRTRRRKDLAALGVPIRHRSASNPGGVGHGWVKRRFIDQRPDGVVFIPAKVADNPGLDTEEYARSLEQLDTVLRAQLLDGDWGAFEGAAFPSFDESIHCVPVMHIPEHWTRFESLDHGLSNPTVALVWAADTDDNLIVFDSYYSERNRLISDHAAAIVEKRAQWWPKDPKGWFTQSPCATPTMTSGRPRAARTSGANRRASSTTTRTPVWTGSSAPPRDAKRAAPVSLSF